MYDKYFGLTDKPFSIAPDPRYLFMSEQHREALAHLVYGVGDGGGFVLLTGEVGTGKTTVCRCLLEQIPENTRIAFILNPKLSATELLATVCDELHITYPEMPNLKELNDRLNDFLLRSHGAGLKIVLMIDEAQNLSIEILEQIRLLTNLETNKEKLLQIILIGQPELKDLLAKHELRQLAQRITARYHLSPLSLEESESYILHRLEVSGFNDTLFDKKAIKELYRRTDGVPRLINVLCDRAMLGAYARNRRLIGPKVVKQAASEVMGGDIREVQADTIKPDHTPAHNWRLVSLALAAIVIAGGSYIFYFLPQQKDQHQELIVPQQMAEKQAIIQQQTAQLEEVNEENQQLKNTIKEMELDDEEPQPEQGIELEPSHEQEVASEITPSTDILEDPDLQETVAIETDADIVPLLPFLPAELQSSGQSQAQQLLLERWNIDYQAQAEGDFCDFASSNQLRCEQATGDWWLLQRTNRPAILKLAAAEGEAVYGVLLGLDQKNVLINFSGKMQLLTRKQVSEYWTGEYQLLWQAPPNYQQPLAISMSGVTVQWLLTSMAKLENLDLIVPPNAVFDVALEQKVQEFQNQHELVADGVVGLHTIIALNSLMDNDIPTLSTTGPAI